MSSLRLIFMGTPEFAIPSLKLLLAQGYEIAAVVTAPDRPRGRGQKVTPSPVKVVAQSHGLPVLQPANLEEPSFIEALQGYQADLQVVVAFRMLPRVVWAMPRLGTFNLHAALLPQYRGAAPIHWAIINGEQETGVTTFFIDDKMDTGHLLLQEKEPIHPKDTAGTLYERLQHKGAQLVVKTVQAIAQGDYTPIPQVPTPRSLQKKAPKIYKADCEIDWDQAAPDVVNFIRGLSPYPAAWAVLRDRTYKILQAAQAPPMQQGLLPGEIYSDGKHYVYVGTQSNPIAIQRLQLAGSKPMDMLTFLQGRQV